MGSSFPVSLRLSFNPDRIFWAGPVRLCSAGVLCKDCLSGCLSQTLSLLLDWLVFRSVRDAAWLSSPSCRVKLSFALVIVAVAAVDVTDAAPNPSLPCATSQRRVWMPGCFSEPCPAWLGGQGGSRAVPTSWAWLRAPGSGEELLLLLYALPVWVLSVASASTSSPGRPVRRPELCRWAAGVACRWYLAVCLLKLHRGGVPTGGSVSASESAKGAAVAPLRAKTRGGERKGRGQWD